MKFITSQAYHSVGGLSRRRLIAAVMGAALLWLPLGGRAEAAATEQSSQNATLTGLWSFDGPDVSGTTASDRSGQGQDRPGTDHTLCRGTQRIERRQSAGLGGPQHAGADIRADEDGRIFTKVQRTGQNNGIRAREGMMKDEIMCCEDVPTFHVDDTDPLRTDVQRESESGCLKVFLGNINMAIPSGQCGKGFSQRKAADGKLVHRVIKQSDDDRAAKLEVVPFHQGTGVKEVQRQALSFIAHLGDVSRQAAPDFRQTPVHILKSDLALGQPVRRNVGVARSDMDPTLLQVFDGNMSDGIGHLCYLLLPPRSVA